MICGRCGGRIKYAGQDEQDGSYDWFSCTRCGDTTCELDVEYNHVGIVKSSKYRSPKKRWFAS